MSRSRRGGRPRQIVRIRDSDFNNVLPYLKALP